MTTQTITTKDLIAANRAALANHTLIAQSVVQDGECSVLSDPCVYSYQQFGCAIGVALDDATLQALKARGYNTGMNVMQLVAFVRFENPEFALQLQQAHDNWATTTGHDGTDYFKLLDAGKPLPYQPGEPDYDSEDDYS